MKLVWLLAWVFATSALGKPAPQTKPKPKPKPAPAAPAASDDDPLPPVHRTVIHTEAYKKREGIGAHLSIKITPPEKRGKKGRVLVELYNYSKTYLSVVDFWLYLYSDIGEKVEVHITADDIKGGWSALKWVKIPRKAKMPAIVKVEIMKMLMYTDKAKEVKMKYFTDLIKM